MKISSRRSSWVTFHTIVSACLISTAAFVALPHMSTRASYKSGGARTLPADSRMELAALRASGDSTVSMVFACLRGQTGHLAAAIVKLGGEIRYRDDSVDYLRARVPMEAAESLVASGAIDAADIDFNPVTGLAYLTDDSNIKNEMSRRRERNRPPSGASAVGDAPLRHPYSPTNDLNAERFLHGHPEFDGRGVTIAYIDYGGFDLLLPEFQLATSLEGKPVPKVVEYKTGTDPVEDPEFWWVPMRAVVRSATTSFDYDGRTYQLPHPGTYRFGLLREPAPGDLWGAIFQWDIDRSGQQNQRFGILWDESTNEVWVDTDRCGDFSKHKPMTDYRVHHDVGAFGRDDPGSRLRGTIGFTVQTDPRDKFIALNLGIDDHATLVLSGAAANGGDRGRFVGIAPGARYAMFSDGGSLHGQVEGLLAAAENPQVDVIVYELFGYISARHYLKDGRMVQSIIADRIVERLHKPVLVTGGNGAGLGWVTDESVGPHVMSVGGYQSKEGYLRNFGLVVREKDNLLSNALGHGPSGDGALKPDVLGPSGQLGNQDGFIYEYDSRPGFAQFPPGYSIGGGTSQAAPLAAGAYALLISAAKQAHIPFDPNRLNYAVRNSARYLSNYPAYQQGNGLIDVEKAWELLQELAPHPPVTITVDAPVRTVNSADLPHPDSGRGIYEREGWFAGSSGERTIVFKRSSGEPGPMTFTCRWIGNDGSFTSSSAVTLPLDEAVPYSVHISMATTGVHSAILACSSPGVPGDSLRMLNTVVAAEDLGSARNHRLERTVSVRRPGDGSLFVYVPKGTKELTVAAQAANPVVFYASSSDGGWDVQRRQAGHGRGTRVDFSVEYPLPGVWELVASNTLDPRSVYDANLPAPLLDTSVEITARLADTVASGISAKQIRGQVTGGKQDTHSFTIDKEVPGFVITLNSASDALNLYAIDCTHVRCRGGWSVPMATGPNLATREIELVGPALGRWVVVVDAANEPVGSTTQYNLTYGAEDVRPKGQTATKE
jgi:Subtilase family